MNRPLALRIQPADNVAVALRDIPAGTKWEGTAVKQEIPRGHKFCVMEIPQGANIIKYGAPIGHAVRAIAPGEWVHTHNVKTNLSGTLEYEWHPTGVTQAARQPGEFQGFHRADGTVGIRNEIWIVPTVGCVNGIAQTIAARTQGLLRGSVAGVYAFPHPYGCSQMGEDLENTKKALCGLIRHPNAGGVLVLGLGCENNTIDGMKAALGGYDSERVRFLTCQQAVDEIAAGVAEIERLIAYAAGFQREPVPMSELVVGLKCGGSDGLSGITANPLVGAFSDRLTAEGGTTLLTEVPEMFGAETLLMDRCVSRELFDQTVALINDFKEYYIRNNQVVYENPSPGNKDGGITTLEDKSLGCTQKGGTSTVTGVLRYGDPVKTKGLNLLQGPGNDLVAATAEAVSGAHVVLFTTGRGTPFGSPVPTVKISTNTALATNKPSWIDFDAGPLVDGETMSGLAERFYEYVRQLASGELAARNEENGIREIAIFKNGVTL